MMKKVFEYPVVEITVFETEDCIMVSGVHFGGDTGAPKAISYTSIANIFQP